MLNIIIAMQKMYSFAKRTFRATRYRMSRRPKVNLYKLMDLTLLLPFPHHLVDPRIGQELLNRVFMASWLCLLTEYQMLWAVLLLERLNYVNIMNWLPEILGLIVFSPWTMIRLQFLATLSTLYGVLMWNIHERMPDCRIWRMENLRRELPIKLALLAVLICFGYCSAWIYLMYITELSPDLDFSYTGHYLLMNGAFCGFVHFLTDHLTVRGEVWPLPLLNPNIGGLQWHRWQHLQFIASAKKTILNCLVYAFISWPNMSGDLFASCQLMWLSIWLTTLMTIKLNTAKTIFSTAMHRKMPVTLHFRTLKQVPNQTQEPQDQLPMYRLLRINDHLFGLQLQAAREFYFLVSNKHGEYRKLFELEGNFGREPVNWMAIRNVTLQNIGNFTVLMRRFINNMKIEKGALKGKRAFVGMRCLGTNEYEDRIWIQYCRTQRSRALIFGKVKQAMRSLITMANELKERYVTALCRCFNVNRPGSPRSEEIELEICQYRKLLWLIPGLVCICVRSLKEDLHGTINSDLERIFQLLIELESCISDIHAEFLARKQQPCITLSLMLETTTCALNRMSVSFDRYLVFIITNQELLQALEDRK